MKRFIFFLLFSPLFAAGPMTHLYLAERYCEINQIQDEAWIHDFLIGNLYPDIRYIAQCPRESTHPESVTLEEIQNAATPFEAGMLFHVWVDLEREDFVEKTGIYASVIPYAHERRATLLKFIEEEIILSSYDPRKWSFLFDEVHPQERRDYVSDEVIGKWHSIIQYTMNYKISWLMWGSSYLRIVLFRLDEKKLYDWSYLVPKMAEEPLFQTHMRTLIDQLEDAMLIHH